MSRVYLDANATTPLDPRVREAMLPWLDAGNASSQHAEGRAARTAIDRSREQVAALVRAHPREIVFCSGATEGNALALLGTIRGRRVRRVLCSAVEHSSVLSTLSSLGDEIELEVAAVGRDGRVDSHLDVEDGVGLVSLMLANNETGAVQPVARVAAVARERGAVVHTDAVQACGKLAVDVSELGVDLLTLSAHKMHGPKGAGALYVRRGAAPAALYRGGEHERGLRPGTENVAAIVGLGAAAEHAADELGARRALWTGLRRRFVTLLEERVPDARVNTPDDAIANTLSLTLPGVEGEAVLLALDMEGIAISTGSACSSGAAEPSHVLLALGHSRAEAAQSVRVSMHAGTVPEEVDLCVGALARAVKNLRKLDV